HRRDERPDPSGRLGLGADPPEDRGMDHRHPDAWRGAASRRRAGRAIRRTSAHGRGTWRLARNNRLPRLCRRGRNEVGNAFYVRPCQEETVGYKMNARIDDGRSSWTAFQSLSPTRAEYSTLAMDSLFIGKAPGIPPASRPSSCTGDPAQDARPVIGATSI